MKGKRIDAKDMDAVGEALKKGITWLSGRQREDGTLMASSHNLRRCRKGQDDDWTLDFSSEMLLWLSMYPRYLSVETEPCRQAQVRC